MQPSKATPLGLTDGIIGSITATDATVDWTTYFGQVDGSTGFYQIMSSVDALEMLGATQSSTISMVNAFQPVKAGLVDGIYLKLSKSGNNILRSSYFGNVGQDIIRKAAIVNNILILPGKYSTPAYPLGQAGVWRVNLTDNTIVKNYFPIQDDYQLTGYPDTLGNIFFTGLGSTSQPDVSTPGAYLGSPYTNDIFLVKYNQNDIKEWGTYYTGNGSTQLGEMTKDSNNYIYLTGMSSGNTSGIATPGTFQQQGGGTGNNDAFVAKFQDCTSSGVVSSNSPICTNSTLNLSASGGTTYICTGPNGFTSNLQNPTIPNATSANSGIYTCAISGSGACDGSFTVNVFVGDNIAPTPNQATLPNITGDCNTIITNYPTAIDNCAGTITATTTDPLSYSNPGTYTIHWTYNDGNGNTSTQTQNVTVSSTPPPVTASNQQVFCATDQPTLSDIQITGQNIFWTDVTGNILFANNSPLVNGETYYAHQTINGCQSSSISIQVTVNSTPKPFGSLNQDFCASANPTLANLVVNGTSLLYYDNLGNILPITTPLVNGQTYYVKQTINSCESEQLAIVVTLSQNNVPATNYRETICNVSTENTMVVNLNSYQQNIINNPSNYTFSYTDALGNVITNPTAYILNLGSNIVYVKVKTADGCFVIVMLELVLNPKPIISLPEDFDFCEGKTTTLDAGSGYTSYVWNTGATTQTITVSTPGLYAVTVENTYGCKNTDSIQLSYSSLGHITAVNITSNTATVIMSTPGNYEYSLDNNSWQDSNIFSQLEMGEYIVYVRNKEGCYIGQKPFSIFNIPNAISPNGDGINDTWKIAGLENYKDSEVSIYDRKGALVFKQIINKTPLFWNGKINNTPVQTGTYWYTIKVPDGRNYSGWLLVKNRN